MGHVVPDPLLRSGPMEVMILCGGLGTRLAEETEIRPKPMVEIGGKPILWHIMKLYSHYGFHDFVLCLGYKGDVIRDYFLSYHARNSDVRVHLGDQRVEYLGSFHDETQWRVVLAETGDRTPTGGRVLRAARHLSGGRFMVTYGDGVANLDIAALIRCHEQSGKLATVTGVRPVTRFGQLEVQGDRVTRFREKPKLEQGWVNGGFFVFEPKVVDYLTEDSTLESEPLERLAADGQLAIFRHEGYWQAVDTMREKRQLEEEWSSGHPPWKVW